MKKAKIFLTALTVLAVVSGALAFKAKGLYAYYTCDRDVLLCTIPVTTTFRTTLGGTQLVSYDVFNAPCKAGDICQTKVTVSP
jgi:hypothetical protein